MPRNRKHSYRMNLYPGKLPVDVRFGYRPPKGGDLFPGVWTYRSPLRALALFPREPYYLSSVIHEGVHLVGWAEQNLSLDELSALVPFGDMAHKLGEAAVREEARCRLMDRWTLRFFDEIRFRRVPYSLKRRPDKPFVPQLDDPQSGPAGPAGPAARAGSPGKGV